MTTFIGTAPDQVPVNAHLGPLAYRDENPSGAVVGSSATQTLTNKTIDIASNTLTGVQASLVSGTNIKTINGATVLGSGDLEVGGGSLILVDEVNASASSTVELVGMDSTYKSYMIVASNLVMSAGNSISFTIQQGGSYLTTGYYGNRAGRFSGGTTQTNAQIENASNFLFVTNSPAFNNFTMDIFDPAAASQQTQWIVFHTGWTSGTSYQTFSNGAQSSAGATTAIKFAPSGGTITSGNFKLYGLGG